MTAFRKDMAVHGRFGQPCLRSGQPVQHIRYTDNLDGRLDVDMVKQQSLITAIAGEFMGSGSKRGRVYTWVPLHLSDAANNCSPCTFLTAWKTADEHFPAPNSGCRSSRTRGRRSSILERTVDRAWRRLSLDQAGAGAPSAAVRPHGAISTVLSLAGLCNNHQSS